MMVMVLLMVLMVLRMVKVVVGRCCRYRQKPGWLLIHQPFPVAVRLLARHRTRSDQSQSHTF